MPEVLNDILIKVLIKLIDNC